MRNSLLLLFSIGILAVGGVSSSFAQVESVNVVENKLVTLIGEGYDPDVGKLAFKWVQIYGDTVELSAYDIPEPTFMAPEVENGEIKVLTFELTVTDPFGASSSDIVEIIVNPVNHPPFVDAGVDRVALSSVNAMTIIPTTSDPDGDLLRYKWEQLSGQLVDVMSVRQKHLTFLPMNIDYSNVEPLVFKITVDDGYGGKASDTVKVFPFTGLLDNKRITVDAGPMQTVTEGQRVTLKATGETLDGKPISYTWAQILGTSANLNSYVGDTVQFIAPEIEDIEEVLSFQVTGYSPGNGWANDLAIIKVLPSNAPPVADAGDDRDVYENVLVKLEGTGTDPDGDKIRFSWAQKSGVDVELYERTTFSKYFITPIISTDSEKLVFELTVTDEHGNYDKDEVSININTINMPPRVSAGPDLKVTSGSQVTISGIAVDPDGDDLTYKWSQASGETVSADKSKLKLMFTAPTVSPETGSKRLAFTLSATDIHNQSDSDQVVIFVVPENSAPTANAGPDRTVNENTQVDLMCKGVDPDNDPLSFSWSSSDIVIPHNMNAKTTFTAPNVIKDSSITVTCTVTDGKLSSSDSVTITVKNTLIVDIVADAGSDRIVNENVRISLDGSKSYDPENQKLSYMWTQISGESVTLSSTSTVKPSFTTPIVNNNEIKVLTFELKVYDDNGREDKDTVMITVDPVNAPPEASATAIQK